MSSKSKKKTPRPVSDTSVEVKQAEVVEPEEHHTELTDVLDVPTGTSPLRYFLMILLVVFLIAIFAIDPGTFQSAARGGADDFLTWHHPTKGEQALNYSDFMTKKRGLNDLLRLFRQETLTDEDVARFTILTALAEDAGIVITDNELRDQLQVMAGGMGVEGNERFKTMMMRSSGGILGFQETLRDQLAGDRYMQLVTTLAIKVSPDDVTRIWNEGHQEYAFDYVALEVANLKEEALAELPDDEALGTWLAELDEFEKKKLEEPERMHAELVGYLVGGENTAEGLLASYPEPEEPETTEEESTEDAAADDTAADGAAVDGTVAEDTSAEDDTTEEVAAADEAVDDGGLAKKYYDRVFFFRFPREQTEDSEAGFNITDRYLSFDEVKDVAEQEAPIYFALERWLADVRVREAGGTPVDLEQEAAAMGLSFRGAADPLSTTEWGEVEGWGGPSLGARISRLEVGALGSVLWTGEGALMVGRLKNKVEGYLPELADIRTEVADAWAEERSSEMAIERLTALRDGFAPRETDDVADAEENADAEEDADDEEGEDEASEALPYASESAFSEAVAALGLEIGRRPFMERATAYQMDPDKDLPGHSFIRFRAELEELAEGELAEVQLNTDKAFAFLVRSVGARDPEPWRLSPGEFEQSSLRAKYEAQTAFVEANFGEEELFKQYGLTMDTGDSEDE